MKPIGELYFDISSEKKGGSLFRIINENSTIIYRYNYSHYNADKDEIKVFEKIYPDFRGFWEELTQDNAWYYLHPLFVHPEQREFVRHQLLSVDWSIHPDKKWKQSHQRQWTKVLSDPPDYYHSRQ